MTLTPITDAAQAILTRLDTAYAGIDPTDKTAVTALWERLLSDDTEAQESEDAA